MATNRVFEDGRRLNLPVEAGTLSGSPCVVGSRCGVALTDRDAAGNASIDFKGVFNLPVTGVTAIGTPIYYTANADPTLRLGVVATALFFGYALEVQNPGPGVIQVYVSEASGISTLAAGSLAGTVVANVANNNLIGGIPVVHRFDVADGATADIDFVLTHKTRIIDAWLVKTANASSNDANSMQLQTAAAAAITDAMSLQNVADTTIVRATQINDANHEIAAGGTLRIRRVRAVAGGQVGCTIYVSALRVA